MLDIIILPALLLEIAAVAFVLWLLPEKNWALFCETVDHFPENCRRLAMWHRRRIRRAAAKLRAFMH